MLSNFVLVSRVNNFVESSKSIGDWNLNDSTITTFAVVDICFFFSRPKNFSTGFYTVSLITLSKLLFTQIAPYFFGIYKYASNKLLLTSKKKRFSKQFYAYRTHQFLIDWNHQLSIGNASETSLIVINQYEKKTIQQFYCSFQRLTTDRFQWIWTQNNTLDEVKQSFELHIVDKSAKTKLKKIIKMYSVSKMTVLK